MSADRERDVRIVDAADSGDGRAVDARSARLERWAEIQALAESLARRGRSSETEAVERD